MTVALVLFGYSVLLATLVPALLKRAKWVERAPRLAITIWQALTFSLLASLILSGVALICPTFHVSRHLADFLRACVMALRHQYASPGGAIAGSLGVLLALGIIARITWSLCSAVTQMVRERNRHRQVLDMVGRRDEERRIVILESDEPAVYCLPGRRSRIVVTTAALRVLDDERLDAVLAHERAHLMERHDLALVISQALAHAFAVLTVFRSAASEVTRLVELRADDVAAAHTDRLSVAEALLAVVSYDTTHALPAMALVTRGNGAARVRRLIPVGNPLGKLQVTAGSLAIAALLFSPLLILAGPASAAVQQNVCPISSVSR
jgi:Zn-dependent protease with chaperone function